MVKFNTKYFIASLQIQIKFRKWEGMEEREAIEKGQTTRKRLTIKSERSVEESKCREKSGSWPGNKRKYGAPDCSM